MLASASGQRAGVTAALIDAEDALGPTDAAKLGVKVDDGATKAILATTARLTRDAKAFVEKHRWELEAAEYDRVVAWISEYVKAHSWHAG